MSVNRSYADSVTV